MSDSSQANLKVSGYFLVAIPASNSSLDLANLGFVQFRKSIFPATEGCPVSDPILPIFLGGSPFEIDSPVICFISVEMPRLKSVRTRPLECQKNHLMNPEAFWFPVSEQPGDLIPWATGCL